MLKINKDFKGSKVRKDYKVTKDFKDYKDFKDNRGDIKTYKKRELSFALFDSLRFSTTFILQIYARKTHARNASVHKPYLND